MNGGCLSYIDFNIDKYWIKKGGSDITGNQSSTADVSEGSAIDSSTTVLEVIIDFDFASRCNLKPPLVFISSSHLHFEQLHTNFSFFFVLFLWFFLFFCLFVCFLGLNRQVQNSAAITTYKRGLNGRCHFILFWSPWEEKLCIKTIIVHGLKKFNEDLMGILLRIQSSYNQTEIRRSTIQKVQKRSLFETRSLL